MSDSAYSRVIRRETHSPRTAAMIVAAVLVSLALVYAGTEIVLSLLDRPALLISPAQGVRLLATLPDAGPTWAIVGVVLAIIGLVFIVLGIAPGRLPKHQMRWEGRAVLVDNGVIAAALAQHLSDQTGIARDDITVGVSHRTIDVTITPALGESVDGARLRELLDTEIDRYELLPTVKSRVRTKIRTEQPHS